MKKMIVTTIASVASLILFVGCGSGSAETNKEDFTTVKVGVVGSYNAHWDTVNELLESEKIEIELIYYSDYVTPNIAVHDKEIDMNAYQNVGYLVNQIGTQQYKLTSIADTYITPMGIFNNKDKISSLEDLEDGHTIAIPSDAVNGGRALKLLEDAGIIDVDPSKGYIPTKADITKYHVNIDIMEADSPSLANLLPDCEGAIINSENAFTAGLSPVNDTIFRENVDPATNPNLDNLINLLVVHEENRENEVYQKVVDAYLTEEVAQTMVEAYEGAFIPVW